MKRIPAGVWIFALSIALVTTIPYVVGWLSTPDGASYSGAPAVPPGAEVDFNAYLGMMWQGWYGKWTVTLPSTFEAHKGMPFTKVYYLLFGHGARELSLHLPLFYHMIRSFMTFVMVITQWWFASYFFDKASDRWFSVLFATVVGGWSWILLLIAPEMTQWISPIEFWLSDAFNVTGAFQTLHFSFAILLQITILMTIVNWIAKGLRSDFALLTIALGSISIVQPYASPLFGTVLLVVVGYHLFVTRKLDWRRVGLLTIPAAVHVGLVLYQYFAMQFDKMWLSYIEQNLLPSPPVVYYMLGYLPFWLPIGFGLRAWWRSSAEQKQRFLIPIVWIIGVALLVYSPLQTQRRYLLGVQTPLAVLAAFGWSKGVLPLLAPQRRITLSLAFFPLASIATILMLVANTALLLQPDKRDYLFYSSDELNGFDWVRSNVDISEVILTTSDNSARGSGGRMVAATGHRVFVGHWIESAYFDEKVALIKKFYDRKTNDLWRKKFLRMYTVRFVWYDNYAREIGLWDPDRAGYLEQVFDSGEVKIYAVKHDALGMTYGEK